MGILVGCLDGCFVGNLDGCLVGCLDGRFVGNLDGRFVGGSEALLVGCGVGGCLVGCAVGCLVGCTVGCAVGCLVACLEVLVGCRVGDLSLPDFRDELLEELVEEDFIAATPTGAKTPSPYMARRIDTKLRVIFMVQLVAGVWMS